MRIMMKAQMSTGEFNAIAKKGNVGKIMNRIIEDRHPEAAYFTEDDGCRTAFLILNIDDASQIPRFAEPWFLNFNAKVSFRVAMTMDDIKKASVDELARKWGEF